ncbi:MAG: retroviral-like aspartic protease family protein [Turicibacter sp.]|nr:retroviral-like aspartic protease family protein [Turicibacter sp.]
MDYNANYSYRDIFGIMENKILIRLLTVDSSSKPVKNLALLLDTGAFITTMSKSLADENGYKITEEKGCAISGFSENGLLCDLRVIPILMFCGIVVENAIIATPHYDNVKIARVLGMNILENFNLGLNLDTREIFASIRPKFVSQKPKYQSGDVYLLGEDMYRGFFE